MFDVIEAYINVFSASRYTPTSSSRKPVHTYRSVNTQRPPSPETSSHNVNIPSMGTVTMIFMTLLSSTFNICFEL